ncbi:MAG TPA: hypothetical protein VKX39_00570 [Bryobacteraceae bacterium]|nr:hypothetical protein [Bryobacteraceae bacterium]
MFDHLVIDLLAQRYLVDAYLHIWRYSDSLKYLTLCRVPPEHREAQTIAAAQFEIRPAQYVPGRLEADERSEPMLRRKAGDHLAAAVRPLPRASEAERAGVDQHLKPDH